jgi:DNA-binding CsgD family transcriptional regulator
MFEFLNADALLKLLIDTQYPIYENYKKTDTPINIDFINQFSENEKSVKIIFDHIDFKIQYISENVTKLSGFDTKNFYKINIPFVLKLITLDHFNFMYVWLKWTLNIHTHYKYCDNQKQAIFGVKIKHKDGHIMRILIRYYPIEVTKSGAAIQAAVTIDDITHLMKSDFYCGRMEFDKDGKNFVHNINSTDQLDKPYDIISDREKETLGLLAQGMESKEIGKLLFISSHTVDNHRRNMIAKIGVRDTTGLIQICKMIGII